MHQHSDEFKAIQYLAREAGRVIMQVYASGFSVERKEKGDPVTEADKKANELIVEGLLKEFPEDGIVAEESPADRTQETRERIWYVDPLDGTNEFIAKNGEFSVMIGLAIHGKSCLGVVYRPDQDLLFGGIADQKAWVEEKGSQSPLSIPVSRGNGTMRMAVSRSHRHYRMADIQEGLGVEQEIRCGSVGLKVALIAKGMADLYVEPGPFTSLWDSCAPEALIRGAGGNFTDLFGNPIQYATHEIKNKRGLVASNGIIHDRIITTIADIARQLYP